MTTLPPPETGSAAATADANRTAALGVVIIAGNEAAAITRCLDSVRWADEIVVLCSGTDATADIARRYTPHVHWHAFDGYAAQRQRAIAHATTPWILGLDADETIPPALADEIRRTITAEPGPAGFAMPRRNYLHGRWVRFGGQYPDWQIRLVRREAATLTPRMVHESFAVPGEPGRLTNAIEHHSRDELGPVLAKQLQYATLEAHEKYQRRRVNGITMTFRPVTAFLHVYIRQQGFRDGYPGLILALIHAISKLQTQLIMWELQHRTPAP